MLKIYNTLSHSKEKFVPLVKGKIGMYVCGVTVYDLCHIGHARTFVNFDVVVDIYAIVAMRSNTYVILLILTIKSSSVLQKRALVLRN